MTDAFLNAFARAWLLNNGVYTFDEATETAIIEYQLDEFQAEDLIIRLRNRLSRESGL